MGLASKESEVLVSLPIGKDVLTFDEDWIGAFIFREEVDMLLQSLIRKGIIPFGSEGTVKFKIRNRNISEEKALVMSNSLSIANELILCVDGHLYTAVLRDSES